MEVRTPPSYTRFQLCNPMRQPDWRWHCASEMVAQHRRLSARYFDELTCAAAKFLSGQQPGNRSKARAAWETIKSARALAVYGGRERLLVESYILAGLSSDEIAARIDVAAPTVEAYEQLFFNIRDRLAARVYIAKAVIIGSPRRPADGRWLLRSFAYYGGPFVIDQLGDDILAFIGLEEEGQAPKTGWIAEQIDLGSLRVWSVEELKKYSTTGLYPGTPESPKKSRKRASAVATVDSQTAESEAADGLAVSSDQMATDNVATTTEASQ